MTNTTNAATFTRWNNPGIVIFSDTEAAREFGIAIGSLPDGPYVRFEHMLIDDVTFCALTVDTFAELLDIAAQWVDSDDDDVLAKVLRGHASIKAA